MGRSRESRVYRVRQLPLHLENRGVVAPFLAKIAPDLGAADNIRVSSLAQEDAISKVATLSFKNLPSLFDNEEQQWTVRAEDICERNIIVDTHFRGFTVLKEPHHSLHTVDCVAISGLASHPFGSWKRRESGSDFMWLRDRLPQDVPRLRSLIYGYDTKLFKSRSFQDLDDIASSFITSLRNIRRSLPPAKPLVFLAHSLGGIVLKRALVLLAHEVNDEDKTILESLKGLVFFGVPHRGMETSHFLAMVAKQPNEDLISRTLSPDSELLPELHEKFSQIAMHINQNIRFVYETAESQMTEASHLPVRQESLLTFYQQTPTGTWIRSEASYAVLVSKDSAVPPGTPRRNAIAVNEDHSNMVKFGEGDPVYEAIKSFIFGLSMTTNSQGSGHGNITPSIPVRKDVGTFSTIPFPKDPCFVGREEILAELESEFANPKSQNWASLYGLGGIGKSQIAIEYSYQQREHFQASTFWVHASSKARFEQSYAEIATVVQIPGAADGKADILQLVSNWLANPNNGPWLLILDNADDATVLLDLPTSDNEIGATSVQRCLHDFLPRVQHGAVLITSRDRTCALDLVGHYGTPIEVRSMSLTESVKLLRQTLPDAGEKEASELVAELGNVPLAISQAGAYIKAVSQISILKYLDIFRRSAEDQENLLNKDKGDLRRDRGVPNAVITSWELSFRQIRERNPNSADLLSLMSYFNRQAIPRFLLQGDVDEISFCEDINPLLSFSLIRAEIGDDSFEMHRLVQTAMRHWLRSAGFDQLWKERAIERVAYRFPSLKDQAQKWPVCEALMSHADEVVNHANSSKISQLHQADILRGTAWYLNQRNRHAGLAEERSTQALRIQRQYLENESEEILLTLQILALAQVELQRFGEATSLQEDILKQRIENRGLEDGATLATMHNLALSYWSLGQLGKAEDLLERVVETRERLLGPDDPQFLVSGNQLAIVQTHQGKLGEAEKLTHKILEISTRCLGVEHVHTLTAMYGLSRVHLEQTRLKEAENLIAQAIPIHTKVFGPSRVRTLESRIILAKVYRRQDKLDEAQEICITCLDTAQESYGLQHLTTLRLKDLLGLIYRDQRKFIDALRLSKDVLKTSKVVSGTDHPETLTYMYNLALCYYDMGDTDQAIQLMNEVDQKRRKVLHANHPYTADSAATLAIWKREKEKTGEQEVGEAGSEEEESEKGETMEDEGMREQLAENGFSSPATQESGSVEQQRKRRLINP